MPKTAESQAENLLCCELSHISDTHCHWVATAGQRKLCFIAYEPNALFTGTVHSNTKQCNHPCSEIVFSLVALFVDRIAQKLLYGFLLNLDLVKGQDMG